MSPLVTSVSMASAAYRLMGEYTRFSLSAKIAPAVLSAKSSTGAADSRSSRPLPNFCIAAMYSSSAAM